MASIKQIEANRKNATKSTGPRTPEGRLASSRDAGRHGLTAAQLVVSVEEEAEFQEALQAFEAELQPVGILQRSLVDQIVTAHWRLRRLREIETGYFEIRLTTAARELEEDFPDLEGTAKLAVALQDDAGGYHALANLSRYETRIERSFYRALHELQSLRSAPAGPPKAPPDAVLPNEPNSAPSNSYRSASIGSTDGANSDVSTNSTVTAAKTYGLCAPPSQARFIRSNPSGRGRSRNLAVG